MPRQNDKNTEFGEKNWTKLCEAIRSIPCSNLHTLSIPNNGLGEKGCKELVRLLFENKLKELRVLNLDGNRIGNTGFTELIRAIQISNIQSQLEEVSFMNNGIGPRGIKDALPYLRQCYFTNLHTLRIGCLVFS